MMSCKVLTAAQAQSYFEHERDYYTKNLTNYDRWHGTLAATYGLDGELSKEQFDIMLDKIENSGRSRAGLDCTFSAPKSVSLAMAKDEATRDDIITAHQVAVKKALDKIEIELLQTRSNKKLLSSRNAVIAEFMHKLARPSKYNDYIPDLDLHSHCVILNETFADGKNLACEYGAINSREMIKELGLVYRQNLAQELQAKGYELKITDSRQGFFELKGFDRETVMKFSSRRREILETAQEHGISDLQKANQYSREKKSKSKFAFEEVREQTKKNLFDNGRIKIERKVQEYDRQGIDRSRGQIRLHENESGQRGNTLLGSGEIYHSFEEFAEKPSLSELSRFGVDVESRRVNMLLSASVVNRLAKFQTAKVRSHYMLCKERRERVERIDKITADTIKKLAAEKFAFTIPEARQRIMAAGVLEGITGEEAKAAMERADLVKLGKINRTDEKSKDIYLTTEKNIEIERAVSERVKAGKGAIKTKVLTMDESRLALDRVERKANKEGRTNFTITDHDGGSGEQAEAVHHILVSEDRYICVDGLAGTGKTTMMERLKWIADEQGIEIKGVCFTGKAADGLEADSGIKSTTIHSFLNGLEKGERTVEEKRDYGREMERDQQQGIKQEWDFSKVQKCQGREIWAVDEAGLVDMHLMNQLQKAAEARGAQILLLGDPDQLPPVGAGEPMRQMEEAGMATAHLYDIRRQKDVELLKAVRESVSGDHLKTFEALEKNGAYKEVQDKTERREAIKQEMTTSPIGDYKKNLLLVSTNADRKAYNDAIRTEYVERGEIDKGQSYRITIHDGEKDRQERRNFAPKDRIIFTANDKRLGVMNGTMATVERIDGQNITVQTDAGERIAWSMDKYNSIDHAYAVTNYKAQGMTVEKVVADMNTKGAAQSRNTLYVDISRAKKEAVVYTDDKAKLEQQTKDFTKKITSKDFEKRLHAMRERGGITNNDRYHAPDIDKSKALEKALAQIEKHTTTPKIVVEWDKAIRAKREAEKVAQADRQRVAEAAAKANTQEEQRKATEIDKVRAQVKPRPQRAMRDTGYSR